MYKKEKDLQVSARILAVNGVQRRFQDKQNRRTYYAMSRLGWNLDTTLQDVPKSSGLYRSTDATHWHTIASSPMPRLIAGTRTEWLKHGTIPE